MGIIRLAKRAPFSLPSADSGPDEKGGILPKFAFFRRRIRLRRNSSISIPLGIVLLFPCIVIVLIVLLFVKHPSSPASILVPSGTPPSIRSVISSFPLSLLTTNQWTVQNRKISEKYDRVFEVGCREINTNTTRANAAFVVLARNKELDGVIQSIKSIERHFNRFYNYPYVFLNDGDFDDNFKDTVTNYTSGACEFGKIGPDMWGFPDWVDHEVAAEGIRKQGDAAIMYGGLESYHHMCRFYSGFFYNHPLLLKYEWYWRLEPEIKYFCDITYDPFIEMAKANKTYGFTIAVQELKETVPNIFRYASAYKRNNNLTSQGLWEMFVEGGTDNLEFDREQPEEEEPPPVSESEFLPDEVLQSDVGTSKDVDPEAMEGEKYNMCHFWSNFEIARLDFFRSKPYEDFFKMMDRSGGFWMERWGDAPIHSLAAGALLSPADIHYFRDFGYRHTTIQHCPANAPARQRDREPWLEMTTEDEKKRREEDEYWDSPDSPKENGVGCRCRCDTDIVDVEGKQGSCLAEWVKVAGGWASP